MELRSVASSLVRDAARAAGGALLMHRLVIDREAAARALRCAVWRAAHAALTLGATLVLVVTQAG